MAFTKSEAEQIAHEFLAGKRLAHSISTAQLAEEMGRQLGLDSERLYVAGMLHDIAKPFSKEQLHKAVANYGLELDEITMHNELLLHAPVGAAMLEHIYDCMDKELLRAVFFHTTGAAGLSLFEQVVYAADFLDPARAFPAQQQARTCLKESFGAALLFITRFTLERVVERNGLLHPDSVDFYNELLFTRQSLLSQALLLD